MLWRERARRGRKRIARGGATSVERLLRPLPETSLCVARQGRSVPAGDQHPHDPVQVVWIACSVRSRQDEDNHEGGYQGATNGQERRDHWQRQRPLMAHRTLNIDPTEE